MPVELSDHAKEVLATKAAEKEAGALPLPGPAGDAFSSGPIQVGEFSVRKVVAYDWRILQKLNNPHILALCGRTANVEPDEYSDWQLIWVLTHSLDEIDATLKKGDLDSRCRNEIASLDLPLLAQLSDAVMEQLRRSISTVVGYGEKQQDGEKKITQLDTERPPMASAGG